MVQTVSQWPPLSRDPGIGASFQPRPGPAGRDPAPKKGPPGTQAPSEIRTGRGPSDPDGTAHIVSSSGSIEGPAEIQESRGNRPHSAAGAVPVHPEDLQLTEKELALLMELQKRDRQVRQHEMAHVAAGGRYVRGGASYTYRTGPDGQRYAHSGEVSIDTSPEPDPKDTKAKMRTVQRAALAQADPSPQDHAVAAKAASLALEAGAELIRMQQERRQAGSGRHPASGQTLDGALDIYV